MTKKNQAFTWFFLPRFGKLFLLAECHTDGKAGMV